MVFRDAFRRSATEQLHIHRATTPESMVFELKCAGDDIAGGYNQLRVHKI
jgi:hypothetical protein